MNLSSFSENKREDHRHGAARTYHASRKGRPLNRNERIVIEQLLKARWSKKKSAEEPERNYSTIRRGIINRTVEPLNSDLTSSRVCNADRAQDVHDLGQGRSGEARGGAKRRVIHLLLHPCQTQVSGDRGGPDEGKGHARGSVAKSIEERPDEVNEQIVFGHWKIDLVAGGKEGGKEALMSLTERKTRRVRIRKLQDCPQAFVLKALRSLESGMEPRAFRAVFKGITADNGTEFPDVEALERSAFSRRKRKRKYSIWNWRHVTMNPNQKDEHLNLQPTFPGCYLDIC
jgi:IS30 family transposase